MPVDTWGRQWDLDKNELDRMIKSHKLELLIEYRTVNDKDSETGSRVKFFMEIKDSSERVIIDYSDFYPLSDSVILDMVRSYFREEKINKLLDE